MIGCFPKSPAWEFLGTKRKFSAVVERKGPAYHAGMYDALSTKIASQTGFEVIFITGYGLAATMLGEPDFGILTQTEMLSAAQRICSATVCQ